ncbi:hypothetical protein SB912_27510, partial [Pantoea sp. SIMBA_072]
MGDDSGAEGVLINLKERLDVRELTGKKEFIQQKALNRLKTLIEKRLGDLPSSTKVQPEDLDA